MDHDEMMAKGSRGAQRIALFPFRAVLEKKRRIFNLASWRKQNEWSY